MRVRFNFAEGENLDSALAVIPLWPIAPWGASRIADRNDKDAKVFQELKLELRSRPEDRTSHKVSAHFKIFEAGSPEQWCRWRDDLVRVWAGLGNTTGVHKAATVRMLLEGQAKDDFNNYMELVAPDVSVEAVMKGLKAVAINIFPSEAVVNEKHYLSYLAKKPNKLMARETATRLALINSWFDYFPSDGGERLDEVPRSSESDLVKAYYRMLPATWRRKMDENQQFDLHGPNNTLRNTVDYAERLEITEARYGGSGTLRGSANKQGAAKANRNENSSNGEPRWGDAKHGGNRGNNRNKDCLIHGKNCGHSSHECKMLIDHAEGARKIYETNKLYNKKYGKKDFGKSSSAAKKHQQYKQNLKSSERTFTREEVHAMLKKMKKNNGHENNNIEEKEVEVFLQENDRDHEVDMELEQLLNEN
jgi:hypothetical protein